MFQDLFCKDITLLDEIQEKTSDWDLRKYVKFVEHFTLVVTFYM